MKSLYFSGIPKLDKAQKEIVTLALLGSIELSIDEGYRVFKVSFCGDTQIIAATIISQLKKQGKDLILEAVLPYSEILTCKNKKIQHLLSRCNAFKVIQNEKDNQSFSNLIEYLTEHSERLIAVWNNKKNNTYHAINYAKMCGKDVKIIHV